MGDLSKHFNRSEFACKCGCGYDTVDAELIEYLEAIRLRFGPVTVTSGCRCTEHNKAVGGSKNSQHVLGRAADIQVKGVEPATVQAYCEDSLIPQGLGSYNSFTHIDTRSSGDARWGV